jgi:hypothetical protein
MTEARAPALARIPAAIGGPMLVARLGVGSVRFVGR